MSPTKLKATMSAHHSTPISETVRNFAVEVWVGVFAPAGTPAPLVNRLSQDIRSVLAKPEIVRQFSEQGFVTKTSTPQALAAYVREETTKWAKVVKASGAKAD